MTTATAPATALASARGLDLAWELPRFGRGEMTLRAGDRAIATLNLPSGRRSPARGAFGESEWIIERRGFWRPTVAVRAPESDADVAVLEFTMWRGGLVDFARAGQFRWLSAGFGPRRMFATYGGDPLVRFSHRVSRRRRTIAVAVDPAAWTLRELPVLLLLGAYLMRDPARAA